MSFDPVRVQLPKVAQAQETLLFSVSLPKLAIMSLFTFGSYEAFWMLKQWLHISKITGSRKVPSLIATCWCLSFYLKVYWGNCDVARNLEYILSWVSWVLLYCLSYPLFRAIRKEGKKQNLSTSLAAGPLAMLWITPLLIGSLAQMPYSLVACLSFLPLLPVQKYVNELNLSVDPGCQMNDKLSPKNWLAIVAGCGFLLWILNHTFHPH
jgi:hypothetical protein